MKKSPVLPIRRDNHYDVDSETVEIWHPAGRSVTAFFNALSLYFPDGERFFIESLRNYRDQITDPELAEAVRQFIGQEAFHGREHQVYNDNLYRKAPNSGIIQGQIAASLKWLQKKIPKSSQLAITIGLEHLTAILANQVLRNTDILGDSVDSYRNLWNWHAFEENEHKGVAYDVWNFVMPNSMSTYFKRIGYFSAANLIFWPAVILTHLQIMKRKNSEFFFVEYQKLLKFLLINPGIVMKILPDWLEYYRLDFHPWDLGYDQKS